MNLENFIADIPDFPKPGIIFKDISPILSSPVAFAFVIDEMAKNMTNVDVIVALDARGFIFGAAISYKLWIPFIPIRKPGKLPDETISIDYDLEYGSNTLEIHKNSIKKGQKIAIVDDLLATGWTAGAAMNLVERLGGEVQWFHFVVHLGFLEWEKKLNEKPIFSLLTY